MNDGRFWIGECAVFEIKKENWENSYDPIIRALVLCLRREGLTAIEVEAGDYKLSFEVKKPAEPKGDEKK